MHELSLAGGILKVVDDAAVRERFARVRRLTLTVGALAGVEERALRFALEALAPGTVLQDAEIVLAHQPGAAWCLSCSTTVPIESRLDACPRCGGNWLQVTGGTDLWVKDLIVEDAASGNPSSPLPTLSPPLPRSTPALAGAGGCGGAEQCSAKPRLRPVEGEGKPSKMRLSGNPSPPLPPPLEGEGERTEA
jgi:hydrogenase nickel incorporation protein HypA/HybF